MAVRKTQKVYKKVISAQLRPSKKLKPSDSVELILYLNYLRYLNFLLKDANARRIHDSSSKILDSHLIEANYAAMKIFRG